MSDVIGEQATDLDVMLHSGLLEVDVSKASPGFDGPILEALKRRAPWWRRWKPSPPTIAVLVRVPAFCCAASFIMLGLLAAVPATRWIVWAQSGLSFLTPLEANSQLKDEIQGSPQSLGSSQLTVDEAAKRYGPNDFQMQLAAAVARHLASVPDDASGVYLPAEKTSSAGNEIRKLKDRFGDRPSLFANILRHDAKLITRRPPKSAGYLLPAGGISTSADAIVPQAAHVQQFISDCETGERLDPQNSYFPMLRAVGLFAIGQDNEALVSLHRAAGLEKFQTYSQDETEGAWRLEERRGMKRAVHRMVVQANLRFYDVTCIRTMASAAVSLAVDAELAGRNQEGLAIRKDIARCGALLRYHGEYAIFNYVGRGVTAIAGQRPNGASKPKREVPGAEDETRLDAQRYATYLRSIGEASEANWYLKEIEISKSLDSIGDLLGKTPASYEAIERNNVWWVASSIVLGNGIWLLLLGVGGWLYLARWKRRQIVGEPRESATVVLVSGLCLILAMFLFASNQARGTFAYGEAFGLFAYRSENTDGRLDNSGPIALVTGAILLLPALITIASVIVAAAKRRAFMRDTARYVRSAALSCGFLLLFVYTFIAISMAQRETDMHAGLSESVKHEGRYAFRVGGLPWPPLKHDWR